jgi:hypothetical protein
MYRRYQDAGEIPGCRQPRPRDTSVLSAGDANRGLAVRASRGFTRHLAGDLTRHFAVDPIRHPAGNRRPKVRAA